MKAPKGEFIVLKTGKQNEDLASDQLIAHTDTFNQFLFPTTPRHQ